MTANILLDRPLNVKHGKIFYILYKMAGRPTFSVLIINHNCAQFLAQAVDSALNQDYPQDKTEILVVDDGSTDNSPEVIKPYLSKVRWLPKENGGAVSAFNYGFKHAKGEYLAILESDDTWDSDKLTQCAQRFAASSDAAMLQHWLRQVDTQGNELPGYDYPAGPEQVNIDQLLDRVLPMTPLSGAVIRTDKITSFMPFPEKFFYGHDICLRLAAAVQAPLAILPKVLGARRIHANNIFGETIYDDPVKLEKTLAFHCEMMDYQRDFLAEHGYTIKPYVMRELETERWLMELFYNAHSGRALASIKAWWKVIQLHGWRLYTLLKAPTLALALVSPRAYLAVQKLYVGSPLLNLRKRTLAP
jgi:glycosyltransferase involved in cell wall biosynthesis